MKYYFPTFDEIDSLRKDYVDAFLAARRVNSMFYRGDDSMGSFCAQKDYDALKMMMKWSMKDDYIQMRQM